MPPNFLSGHTCQHGLWLSGLVFENYSAAMVAPEDKLGALHLFHYCFPCVSPVDKKSSATNLTVKRILEAAFAIVSVRSVSCRGARGFNNVPDRICFHGLAHNSVFWTEFCLVVQAPGAPEHTSSGFGRHLQRSGRHRSGMFSLELKQVEGRCFLGRGQTETKKRRSGNSTNETVMYHVHAEAACIRASV